MESVEIRPYAVTLTKIIGELRSKLREEGAEYKELHFSHQVRPLIIFLAMISLTTYMGEAIFITNSQKFS